MGNVGRKILVGDDNPEIFDIITILFTYSKNVHPEPLDSPLVLRFSKDEWRLRTGSVEGTNVVSLSNHKLSTNGLCEHYWV